MAVHLRLGFAALLAALLAALIAAGITLAVRRRGPELETLTFQQVCGRMDACWAVRATTSAISRLARASDGRHWIFNNESPPRGAYSDGVDMEMVGAAYEVLPHTMGEAHMCMISRCDEPLRACGSSAACRGAWTDLMVSLGSVVDAALLRPEHIARQDSRDLAECFFSQCLCLAAHTLVTRGDRSTAGEAPSDPHVARFPNTVDDDDVAAVLSLAASVGENETFVEERVFGVQQPRGRASPLGGQRVTYLQSRFTTDPRTARLYTRLRELVIQADAQSGWRRAHAPTLVPRTIELLNYTSSAQSADADLSLGWHTDEQSALTALLLLSDPAEHFSGGELYHLAHGQQHAAHARHHELLVYRSHTPHAVGALTAGTRLAVALEFWHVHAPGEGADHPAYPYRRVAVLPRAGVPDRDPTLGRCPR